MTPILHHLALNWWSNLFANTWRYAIFATATWALLSVMLKTPLRRRKIRAENPAFGQMALEFAFSMRSVVVFATVAVAMTAMSHAGWYPLGDVARRGGAPWFWTSVVLMILGHDAYYYWSHRAMHRWRPLRASHRRHHLSRNPSPFTAYSFDMREAVLMASFAVLWPLIVPTSFAAIPLFILHQIVRNTLAHCGYELMPASADGRPMFDFLTTPTHHDLHHQHPNSNFGLYFTWWDRWMGTEHPDYHAAFARRAAAPPVVVAVAA